MRVHATSDEADAPSFLDIRAGLAALVAGTGLTIFERGLVALLGGASPLALRPLLAWWGANVGMALVVLLLAGGATALSRFAVRAPGRSRRRRVLAAVVFGLALCTGAAPLGDSLTTGGWISQQSWGFLLRGLPSAVVLLTGLLTFWLVTSLQGRARVYAGVVLGGIALALLGLDHHVLLGTYPEVHLTLHGVSVALVVFGAWSLPYTPTSGAARKGAWAALAVAVCAPAFWHRLPLGHRPGLSLASPMANVLMEFTMPKLELKFAEREFAKVDPNEGSYRGSRSGTKLERTDWNVLWITVDTLRWDALWPGRKEKGAAFARPRDTPFLNSWLRKTVLFSSAYAQSSATHRSMPPMFRSLEAHERTLRIGTPLGAAAGRTGRTSLAVVNNFFLEPRYKRSQSLLWGFDVVEIYAKTEQDVLVNLFDRALTQHQQGGFFAWLHFYNMHAPGYAVGGLQSKGSLSTRYRRSLRWMDARMRDLIRVLESHGLADNTIVVFSADHGEGLGANRITNHGPTVFEEEIRVPLAFHIPGVAPRVVSQTVGNVDIVPTLWDAMGVERGPTFRGRSLLGAIVGEPLSERPYYLENASGKTVGVVLGGQKLIQKLKSGTTMRFDLATDPTEDDNLFVDGLDDQPLLAALYAKNPNLVPATELMGHIAAKTLQETDAASPGDALRYVLNVAARSEVSESLDAMQDLFRRTPHLVVKLEVLSALLLVDRALAAELAQEELLRTRPEDEARFVEGLAQIGVTGVDDEVVEARFAPERVVSDEVASAWMHWVLRWKKPPVGPALVMLAGKVRQDETPSPELMRVMAKVMRIAPLREGERRTMLAFNRWLLNRGDPLVLPDAVATAGELRDLDATEKIREISRAGPIRARQAALYALAAIDGVDAVNDIVAAGAEPNLVLDAVKALQRTGSPAAIPFVQGVAKTHHNRIIRNNAKSALKKLKK